MINVVCYKVRDEPIPLTNGMEAWLLEHVGKKGDRWTWTWIDGTPNLAIAFDDEDDEVATIFKLKYAI